MLSRPPSCSAALGTSPESLASGRHGFTFLLLHLSLTILLHGHHLLLHCKVLSVCLLLWSLINRLHVQKMRSRIPKPQLLKIKTALDPQPSAHKLLSTYWGLVGTNHQYVEPLSQKTTPCATEHAKTSSTSSEHRRRCTLSWKLMGRVF